MQFEKCPEIEVSHEEVTFTHEQVMNIRIVFEINLWPFTVSQDFTLRNYLFGTAKLTRNTDPDKYKNSSYGIGFDASAGFSLFDGSRFCRNVVIFGADMSLFVHINNNKKISLFLVKVRCKV